MRPLRKAATDWQARAVMNKNTPQANRPENQLRPEWGDCKTITRIFGIHKSTIYRLVSEGKIRGVSLRERGKLRGKKLISLDSVAAFIESMATDGEGDKG